MSIVETYKREFKIYCYDEDLLRSSRLEDFLKDRQFNYTAFNSRGMFLDSVKADIPHVIVLYYQPMSLRFREILDSVRKLSSEVEIVILGSNEFWPGIHHLLKSGLVNDFWSWPVANEMVLSLRFDKIIEKTIYKYIAEQRSEESQKIVNTLEELKPQTSSAMATLTGEDGDISQLVWQRYSSENQVVEALFNQLKTSHPQAEFVYFKNYPARQQLLVTRTSFSSEGYFRGQSVPFHSEGIATDRDSVFNATRDSIAETFAAEDFVMQPVEFADNFFGIIMAIHFTDSEALQKTAKYLAITLRNLSLETQRHTIENSTPLEKRLAGSEIHLKLSTEVSRARRLKSPLSVITAHVDYIGDDSTEKEKAFEILRANLRDYDFIGESSEGRFVMLLPHCGHEDAAYKAEALRRHLVARGVKSQNTPLRLCFGVSEFPSLASDSDALLETANKACDQVFAAGKNKVCLYTTKSSFEPEFTVRGHSIQS